MAGISTDITANQAARIAGSAWLIVIFSGIAAEFFIRMPLMVPGDPLATAQNIAAASGLFRLGIAADIVMLLFDALAAVALYTLFRSVHNTLAFTATVFRLIMNAVLAANLVNLALVLSFAEGAGLGTKQPAAMVQIFQEMHGFGYDTALVFFGVHCFLLGLLLYRSGYVPKFFGVLLLSASLGYVIDSFAHILLPQGSPLLGVTASVLIGVAVLAELSLSLWLVVKGVPAQAIPA